MLMKRYDRLSRLDIKKPCSADWNAMTGDETKRYCGQCRKHVHNLSEMPADEAEALLQLGSVCVRYRSDERGRIITKSAVIAGLAMLAVGCESTQPSQTTGALPALPPESEPQEALTGKGYVSPAVAPPAKPAPQYEMGDIAMPAQTMGKPASPDSRGDVGMKKGTK
jgi:hypothetical protein